MFTKYSTMRRDTSRCDVWVILWTSVNCYKQPC